MSIVPAPGRPWDNGYPTSDGKPVAETDLHRDEMFDLIAMLRAFFFGRRVYVSGNLLVYYQRGNRRKHVSPDVFVVRRVDTHRRPNYLIWEEKKGPEAVIELTSASTRNEDVETKHLLYQNVLKVREYFLFDPYGDYLDPPLQGYRLRKGVYHRIRPANGRLPSQVLGLHLEHQGNHLRLWDPSTGMYLPTPEQRIGEAEESAEQAEARAEQAEARAEQAKSRAELAETEIARLRRLVEQAGIRPETQP